MIESNTTPEDATDAAYRAGQRIAVVSIAVSASLAVLKISAGLVTNSAALTADGIESASDIMTSAVLLGGMAIARRPPDERFPYGYGRAESIAGKTIGTMLIMVAALLGARSFHALLNPVDRLPSWAVIPLAISFVLKGVLAGVKQRAGRRYRSTALKADAANDMLDMLSATAAGVAVALAAWSPERFARADGAGGVAVALIILIIGVRIFRRTSSELMDEMPEESLVREVREVARRVGGVLAVEKCYGRKSGLQYFFDLHIEVDPNMSVSAAHDLGHIVQSEIVRACPFVRDVLVHIEPHAT